MKPCEPPERIWVHPWPEGLLYSLSKADGYIEYVRITTALQAARPIVGEDLEKGARELVAPFVNLRGSSNAVATLDGLVEAVAAFAQAAADERDAEIQRLNEIIEGKVDSETVLRWLNVRDGAIDLGVSPPEYVRHVLAHMFAFAMEDAPNFVTAQLTMKAHDYEMTIRKVDGKTPAQLLCELRAEMEAAADAAVARLFCAEHRTLLTESQVESFVCFWCAQNKIAENAQGAADAAREAERERCATIAEAMRPTGGRQWTDEQLACYEALTDCAANIRVEGEKQDAD